MQDEREDAVRARMSAGAAEPAPPGAPENATPAVDHADIDEEMTSVNDRRAFPHVGAATASSAPAAPDALTYHDAPGDSPAPPPWARHDPQQSPPAGMAPSPRGPFGARPPRPGASNVPWQAAASWGPTTLTLDANTTAGVSYLFWWLSGLFVYFNERSNRYVRFHAMQSILLTSALTVVGVVAYVLDGVFLDLSRASHLVLLERLGHGIAALTVAGIAITWLAAMIGAWTGHYLRFPYIGAYAERYSAPPVPPSVPPAF